MLVLVLSGEEIAFRSLPGVTPALRCLRILELYPLLAPCLGHPSLFSAPRTTSHTFLTIAGFPLPRAPTCPRQSQPNVGPVLASPPDCWSFEARGLASWLSKWTSVPKRAGRDMGHARHQTYRDSLVHCQGLCPVTWWLCPCLSLSLLLEQGKTCSVQPGCEQQTAFPRGLVASWVSSCFSICRPAGPSTAPATCRPGATGCG